MAANKILVKNYERVKREYHALGEQARGKPKTSKVFRLMRATGRVYHELGERVKRANKH